MAIDINGLNPNQPGSSRNKGIEAQPARQKLDASTEKTEATIEKRGESVSFSGQAKDFQQIEAGLKDSSGIDEGKVAAIRAALEDGSYEISAERVAQKMLDMEKDIF